MAFIQMTYDQWVEKFKPLNKPGTDHIYFDTHNDVEFLKKQPSNKIWTLVSCIGNDWVILNGCHWVNRMEYYVTEIAHDPEDEYNVE